MNIECIMMNVLESEYHRTYMTNIIILLIGLLIMPFINQPFAKKTKSICKIEGYLRKGSLNTYTTLAIYF